MKSKRSFVLVAASLLLALASVGCADAPHDGAPNPSDRTGGVGTEATGGGVTLSQAEAQALGLLPTDWVVFVEGPGNVFLEAGEGPVAIAFTVENGGENADNYAISAWSQEGLGFADFSGVPAEIALDPGESQEVTIEVTILVGTAAGVSERLLVRAASTLSGLSSPDNAATRVFVIAK